MNPNTPVIVGVAQVDAGEFNPATDFVDLAGNFNGWGGNDPEFWKLTDDDMKISHTKEMILTGMSKKLNPYQGGYIGMTFVPQNKLASYWKAAHDIEGIDNHLNVESVLQHLIEGGEEIDILDVSGSVWIEVDTQKLKNNLGKIRSFIPSTGRCRPTATVSPAKARR